MPPGGGSGLAAYAIAADRHLASLDAAAISDGAIGFPEPAAFSSAEAVS
jgi:hypothetical protein